MATADEIAAVYRAYINAINNRQLEDLDKFVSYPVTNNGHSLSQDQHLANISTVTNDLVNAVTDVDLLIVDHDSVGKRPVAAARLLVTMTPGPMAAQGYGLDPSAGAKRVRVANHFLIWFTEGPNPKIAELANIVDIVAMGEQLRNQDRPLPDNARASIFSKPEVPAGTFDLGAKIREWYAHSEKGGVSAHAAEYFHDNVTVIGMSFPREQFADFIEKGLEILTSPSGLKIDIKALVVDNQKQQVSCRFSIQVKLNKPYMGIEPNGKEATLEEQAFYQFDQGRIVAMDTVSDIAGLRRQMYS